MRSSRSNLGRGIVPISRDLFSNRLAGDRICVAMEDGLWVRWYMDGPAQRGVSRGIFWEYLAADAPTSKMRDEQVMCPLDFSA